MKLYDWLFGFKWIYFDEENEVFQYEEPKIASN